ncbi:transposase [Streptomyces sp. NPDC059003]|uniref:transposase n=1 Tax=Streptomyces sp. NPDC059003 TaxID=3346691 RepID=UPI0036D20454
MVMKFYSLEFKADAVALYLSGPDLTLAGVAEDLGVGRGALRDWIRARRGEDATTTSTVKEQTAVSEPSRGRAEGRDSGPAHRTEDGAQGERDARPGTRRPAEGRRSFPSPG